VIDVTDAGQGGPFRRRVPGWLPRAAAIPKEGRAWQHVPRGLVQGRRPARSSRPALGDTGAPAIVLDEAVERAEAACARRLKEEERSEDRKPHHPAAPPSGPWAAVKYLPDLPDTAAPKLSNFSFDRICLAPHRHTAHLPCSMRVRIAGDPRKGRRHGDSRND